MSDTNGSGRGPAFGPRGHPFFNVHLDWFGRDTPYAMAEGFKEAADKVIEATLNDPRHPDMFFYPVAFLYRHYLELQLKNILDRASPILAQSGQNMLRPVTHDLKLLWAEVRKAIILVWPQPSDETDRYLRPVDDVIHEYHLLDRSGQAFRYHRDTRGKLHLAGAPKLISLERLMEVMDEVYGILSGCESGIGEAVGY